MATTHENNAVWHALKHNLPGTFMPDEILDIMAEVPGENEVLKWWWILALEHGSFALLSGWCDDTGWEHQSGIEEIGIYTDALLAASAAPLNEEYSNREIRRNLIAQIVGASPKFTYLED